MTDGRLEIEVAEGVLAPSPSRRLTRGGSSVGLPVRDRKPHVGVTKLAWLAPARQVLAGQLLSGGLDQLGLIAQIAAEQGDGLVTPERGHQYRLSPQPEVGHRRRQAATATPPAAKQDARGVARNPQRPSWSWRLSYEQNL